MADMKTKDLQAKEKQEVTTQAEQTMSGLLFTPEVDIFETDTEITLLADIPGVSPDGLDIDLRENTLTIIGNIEPFKGADEEDVLIEYETGKYYRQFTISQVIDQEKINADLKDGVLRLKMPKARKAVPRKIAINA
jgi:HSP20 family protein